MTKTGRILLLILLGLLFVVGFALLMTALQKDEVRSPTYSTLHNHKYGAESLFRILQQKGYEVERNYYSPEEFAGTDSMTTLVMLCPSTYVQSEEKDSLHQWIRRGNRLLWVPERYDMLFRDQGIKLVKRPDDVAYLQGKVKPQKCTPAPQLTGIDSLHYGEWNDGEPMQEGFEDGLAWVSSDNDQHTFCFGSDSLPLVPLLCHRGDVVMAKAALGKGEIVMMGQPWPFCNQGLTEGSNLVFALSVFESMGGKGRKVVFDEYFHGFKLHKVATPINEVEARAMILCLLGTFGLAVVSLRRRRARAVPVHVEPRRNVLEFVESMGRVFRKRGGELYLFEDVAARFRVRLQLSLGLANPQDIHNRELVRRLSTQKWGVQESRTLLLLLDDIHATGAGSSPKRLVHLTRAMRDFSIRNKIDRHGSKENNR